MKKNWKNQGYFLTECSFANAFLCRKLELIHKTQDVMSKSCHLMQ